LTPAAREQLLVVTDLDGCLLDEQTYSYEAAREALSALRERGVPLVVATSKTRSEVEPLARELSLQTAMIVENGGAILIPPGHLRKTPGMRSEGAFLVVMLGTRREALVRALADIAEQTKARVRGFASMSAAEVARLTGLRLPDAERALRREYDEPFVLEGGPAEEAAVRRAARRRGLLVTRGGRFHHLTGPVDKGRGLQRLLALYAAEGRRFTTIGLGDSGNDLPLLREVNRPILVPRPDGKVDEALRAAFPHAERAPAPGPTGWNAAVLAVLRGGGDRARVPAQLVRDH
jgi:mannosyl-3-phosphoglycerate phosphatase